MEENDEGEEVEEADTGTLWEVSRNIHNLS